MLARSVSVLAVLGIVIALFGIGMDHILPGLDASGSTLQLVLAMAGLSLVCIAAMRLRNSHGTGRLDSMTKRLAIAAMIVLATLLALEAALSLQGMPTYFPADSPGQRLTVLPWWVCDDAGCHYDYASVLPACETGELSGRVCEINRQGYADSEDFVLPVDYETSYRILLLGDSFTWGMRADLGASYAETLSAELPGSVIWNTGIPGTGTNQAQMVFDVYAPLLQPQLTILGFVKNDFDDNLLPVDSWMNAMNAEGQAIHIRRYAIDDEEGVIKFDHHELEFIQAHQMLPPRSALEGRLGSTRLRFAVAAAAG